MSDAIRICAATDIPKGNVIAAQVDELPLAIVHGDDDNFYAVYDECSHAQIPLSEGELDGCTMEWLKTK